MPNSAARHDGLCDPDNALRVDAEMAVEIRDRSRLAETRHPEGPRAMSRDGTQPTERCRVAVEHGHDPAMGRQAGQKALDMAAGVRDARFAGGLCGDPAGVEAVRGRDRQETDVAAVLRACSLPSLPDAARP